MKTITVPAYEQVSPANQAIFDNLKKGLGFVPNLYATFAHSDNVSHTAWYAISALRRARDSSRGSRPTPNAARSAISAVSRIGSVLRPTGSIGSARRANIVAESPGSRSTPRSPSAISVTRHA